MSQSKNKLVIFDFDGVIANTSHISHEIVSKTNPHISFEDFQKMSHGNFYDSFRGENPVVKYIPDPSYPDQYHVRVRECDIPIALQEAVKRFSEEYILAIVSSSFEHSIRHFLEKDNLERLFSDILGSDTHTSKVVKLENLLKKHSIDARDAVFITDTLGDVLESNKAGIRSIGVVWGLHDRETLERGNPAIIIDDPALLEATVEGLFRMV